MTMSMFMSSTARKRQRSFNLGLPCTSAAFPAAVVSGTTEKVMVTKEILVSDEVNSFSLSANETEVEEKCADSVGLSFATTETIQTTNSKSNCKPTNAKTHMKIAPVTLHTFHGLSFDSFRSKSKAKRLSRSSTSSTSSNASTVSSASSSSTSSSLSASSLWRACSSSTSLQKNKSKLRCELKDKKVCFAESVKTWDGPRPLFVDFDELLFCFLIKGKAIGDGDILKWTRSDAKRVFTLCILLSELLCRVRQLPIGTIVPCLPRGGGRALRIEKCYEPYLVTLFTVLLTALKQALKENRQKSSSCSNKNTRGNRCEREKEGEYKECEEDISIVVNELVKAGVKAEDLYIHVVNVKDCLSDMKKVKDMKFVDGFENEEAQSDKMSDGENDTPSSSCVSNVNLSEQQCKFLVSQLSLVRRDSFGECDLVAA